MRHEDQLVVEDVIAALEVPEQANIAVRVVEGLVHEDIGVATQSGVHRVVLQVRAVQVGTSVLVHSVLSKQALQEPHPQEVGVSVSWGQQTHTSRGVFLFVVSHEGQSCSEVRLVGIGDGSCARLGELAEGLTDSI